MTVITSKNFKLTVVVLDTGSVPDLIWKDFSPYWIYKMTPIFNLGLTDEKIVSR